MKVEINPRASVALRALNTGDRRRVDEVLTFLARAEKAEAARDPRCKKLVGSFSGDLYTFRASDELRVVFSWGSGRVDIEDIVHRSLLGAAG